MIVAVAQEGNKVCAHFGHCEQFALYDTEMKSIKAVANPGHEPGVLPGFLKQLGADIVIAGGMGGRAQDLFADQGIKVIVGITGSVEEALKKFEAGQLISSGSVCSEHAYEGHCHD